MNAYVRQAGSLKGMITPEPAKTAARSGGQAQVRRGRGWTREEDEGEEGNFEPGSGGGVARSSAAAANKSGAGILVTGKAHLGESDPTYEQVEVKPAQLKVLKASYDDLKEIPRLNYTGAIMDCVYQHAEQEETPGLFDEARVARLLGELQRQAVRPCVDGLRFCGFAQQHEFLDAIDAFCSGRGEHFFWHKMNRHNHGPQHRGAG
ncbi:hypothetical protein CYMTET_20561 [Cymbomonas tetramitiformis]|uniref:Uncharacterized protein n=1 Tax=Cymbomonas tetramitiformis TaxID=36881 RepID=A0AAE0G561_9CHLO|nr:hypothetical protein CYMTET_20561 [Cymbomonas tetramitiformis]